MKNSQKKIIKGCLISFLLVVCLLIFVLIPAVTRALESTSSPRPLRNGTVIYKSVFAEVADVKGQLSPSPVKLPQSPGSGNNKELEFENSTDYFKFLVEKEILPVNWSYFGGKNIEMATGKFDPDDPSSLKNFQAENNMWCVVADLDPHDSGAPFLISRNLQGTRLEKRGRPELSGPPYGKKNLIVIRMGGAAGNIRKKDILWENINPGGLDNKILRP